MPLHRTTHEQAAAKVAEVEAAGETVVGITADDGGVYIATSKKAKRARPGEKETR